MSAIRDLQDTFARALTTPALPVPEVIAGGAEGRAERRFAVYRNNVVVGLVSALAARFPVTQKLVGEDFFRAMAYCYVQREPPRSPIMLHYGATFPAFVAQFPPVVAVPYLADIARLELARGQAYHAPDRIPLAADAFAALAADQLSELRVRLHPSVAVVRSEHPIVSIWAAHQDGTAPVVVAWVAEDALVTRPGLEVEVRRLPAGVAAFIAALGQGTTVAAAALSALQNGHGFDLASAFAIVIDAGVAVGFAAR